MLMLCRRETKILSSTGRVSKRYIFNMPCSFFCFMSKLPEKKRIFAIDIPRVSCCHVTSIYHAIPFYFFIKFLLCISSSSSFRSLSLISSTETRNLYFLSFCCCCSCCIIICLLPHSKNTALLLVEETEVCTFAMCKF